MENRKTASIHKYVRDCILSLQPYSSARDEYISDGTPMVFLDANENPFENGLNRYPDPQQRNLKRLLAEQKGLNTSQILLGNGSDEVLDLLFRAFCEPYRDNVITLPPTYGMYGVLAGVNAVENRKVLLKTNFQPDVGAILDRADADSKLLFLCSPNNPTANSFSAESVRSLLEGFPGLVVIDEAYIDFSEKESWLSGLARWPRLIVTQTLSKAYGMAGIRLGICYGSADIIGILNKIKPPYNVNILTQLQAYEGVNNQKQVKVQTGLILDERRKLRNSLRQIPSVKEVFPSDANFLLVRMDDATRRYEELLARGIVVRNRSNQPLCENTLRFTVGTPDENEKLVQALKTM